MEKKRSGRWSHYEKLLANERVKPYLRKTELYPNHALLRNLQKQITIRPCFGYDQLDIVKSSHSSETEQYDILNRFGHNLSSIKGKQELHDFLSNIYQKSQYYIIQDKNFLFPNRHFSKFFITLQHDSQGFWDIRNIQKDGDSNQALTEKTLTLMKDVAIEIASTIGKDEKAGATIVITIGVLHDEIWMEDIEIHYSKSKWSQYILLSSLGSLLSYLPPTKLATTQSLFEFLQTFNQVMLKPCFGQLGKGIVKVSALGEDTFEIHHKKEKQIIDGKKEIIEYLQTHFFIKERYVVQKRIDIGTINDCVFDIRVMVQREDCNQEWEVTGQVAKVATKGYIVSNMAKSILPVEEALKQANNSHHPNELLKQLDFISLLAAKQLSVLYQGITRVGIDAAIDRKGKIWLLEMNLVPDVAIFRRLKDKTIFEKIIKRNRRKQ